MIDILHKNTILVEAAIKLEAFLSDNVGHNADWPIHFHVDNDQDANILAELLTNFSQAVREYRKLIDTKKEGEK